MGAAMKAGSLRLPHITGARMRARGRVCRPWLLSFCKFSPKQWRIAQVLTSERASRCKPLRLRQITAARTLARGRMCRPWLLSFCKFSPKKMAHRASADLRRCVALQAASFTASHGRADARARPNVPPLAVVIL
jgi:hypothetical protein